MYRTRDMDDLAAVGKATEAGHGIGDHHVGRLALAGQDDDRAFDSGVVLLESRGDVVIGVLVACPLALRVDDAAVVQFERVVRRDGRHALVPRPPRLGVTSGLADESFG